MRPALRQILFGRPGWVFPGASVDLDFARGLYFGGDQSVNISLSRASTGYAQNAAGVWLSFGNNVARITDQGFLIEEARTNKCANFNANPTDLTGVTKLGDAAATLTVVDDTAALAAAGLQNIATSGKVFKFDNSAGTGNAFANIAGATGNVNLHTLSIYWRGSGNGQIRLTPTGTDHAITAAYARYSVTQTPDSTARVFIVQANPGAVVYFILNQLEEGSFVTSPIVTAGASATRAADIPQLTGAAANAASAAHSLYAQMLGVNINSQAYVYRQNAGGFIWLSSATNAQIFPDASHSANGAFGSGTAASVTKISAGFDAASGTIIANGGAKGTAAFAWSYDTPTYIGNNPTGTRALNGYMQRFALSPVKGVFDALTI